MGGPGSWGISAGVEQDECNITALRLPLLLCRTPKAALARYFIGHYNPLRNHFCAFAMKDQVVEMLDPKPAAYVR